MIGLALGVPKMGKTQALLDFVGASALTNRFLVVDRADDWKPDGEGARWRGMQWRKWDGRHARIARALKLPALPVATDRPWFADAPPPSSNVEGWLESLPPSGVFRFGWPWEGEDVARFAVGLGSCTYVDDELDLVALQEKWKSNPLRDVCHRGRHLPNDRGELGQVHLLGAARRAQSLHIDVTSLADWVFVFRVQGHRTLQRLLDDRILEDDEVETARQLEPYRYKLWRSSDAPEWGKLAPL